MTFAKFTTREVEEQLEEIRQEVEEACKLDSETEFVPESAYTQARFLLNMLQAFSPMPHIMWLEDGGIGFEWCTEKGKGIGIISIYGDNKVTYNAALGADRKIKETCSLSKLSSLAPLRDFLLMLRLIYQE